ncbi:MAG TPA: hypothetical protein PKO07_21390 [Pseudomonadota bacterium]|nr:hypothetical protein [Pseudomonadota bacterium]
MRMHTITAAALCGTMLFSAPFAVADIPPNAIPQAAPKAQPNPTSGQQAPMGKAQIVATVRIANLSQSIKTLAGYVPFPLPVQESLQQVVGDFAKVINQAAPLDFALALEQDAATAMRGAPPWAVALSTTSAEETRKIAKSQGLLGENRNGQTQLRFPLGKNDVLYCVLQGQAGPGKLTCAPSERERDMLSPQLANLNVPGAQGKDLYAEVSVASLLGIFGTQWKQVLDAGTMMLPQRLAIGDPKFDRAATDAVQALIGQVALTGQDLSLLALDLTLRPDQVQVALGYKMSGTQSAWAKADAAAAARKPIAPPAAFSALPKEVVSASYYVTDPRWSKQVVELLLPLVDGFLAHDGLAEADRQAIRDLLLKQPKWDGVMTTVLGEGIGDKPAAAGDPLTNMLSNHYYLSTAERENGGVDESPAFLRALAATWNRPGLQAYLKKKWKTVGIKSPIPIIRAETVGKPFGSDAAGLYLSLDLSGWSSELDKATKGQKRGPFRVYLFSAQVAGRVWSAVAADKNLALQKLQRLANLPASETLASRSGLAQVQQPGWQSAGFTTLAGWIGLFDTVMRVAEKSPLGKGAAPGQTGTSLLNVIPHHGEVPITYGAQGGSIGPQGMTKVMSASIPRLVIEDLIALAMNIGGGGKK